MAQNYGSFSAKTATITVMNIPANAWTATPTTTMNARQLIEVFIKDENKVYWTFEESTASTPTTPIKYRGALGTGELRIFPIQDNLTLYLRAHSGSARVIVTEYK